MLKYVILLTCFATALTSFAQFNETIRTGRPGQSIGAFTVGEGIFQLQSGVDYFNSKNAESNIKIDGFLSNTVLRYGLTEPFEISALIEYKTEAIRQEGETTTQQGLSGLDVGMRYHIYTGRGLIPNIGFQFRTRLPVSGDAYAVKDIAPRFLVATSQQLSDRFTLITNWGASWNGNNSVPTGIYVINLSFPFNTKFGAFIENYGSVYQGTFVTNMDTGLAWLITNNFQLDILGGYGNNHGIRDFFVSTGISWRTSRK